MAGRQMVTQMAGERSLIDRNQEAILALCPEQDIRVKRSSWQIRWIANLDYVDCFLGSI